MELNFIQTVNLYNSSEGVLFISFFILGFHITKNHKSYGYTICYSINYHIINLDNSTKIIKLNIFNSPFNTNIVPKIKRIK